MGLMKTLTINGKTYALSSVVPASSVTLLADRWVSDGEAYSQVVEVQGVTSCSKVDLQPTPEQLAEFHHKVLGFVAENDYGIVTVYAIGDKPLSDHTIQITLTEVEKSGKIRGNTVGTTMPRANLGQDDPKKADYVVGKEAFLKKALPGVTPQMFGAKADGVTDDTAAIQAALDKSGNIYFPDGTYLINATHQGWWDDTEAGVKPQSNSNIVLAPGAVLKAMPNSTGRYSVLNLREVENITITGGKIAGERHEHIGTEGEFGAGILISECNRVLISNMEIYDCWGDGICVISEDELTGENNNIHIDKCIIHDCRRQGISWIIGGENNSITNCHIYGIYGTMPQSGIDIEANDSNNPIVGLVIDGCEIHNTSGASIIFSVADNCHLSNSNLDSVNYYNNSRSSTITNCYIKDNVNVCGKDLQCNNCHIGYISHNGGSAIFTDCLIKETDENASNYSVIHSSTDSDFAGEYLIFNDCVFWGNGKEQFGYIWFQRKDGVEYAAFRNCDFYNITKYNVLPNAPVEFINCNFHIAAELWSIFSSDAPGIKILFDGCKLDKGEGVPRIPFVFAAGQVNIEFRNNYFCDYDNFLYSGEGTGKIVATNNSGEAVGCYVSNGTYVGVYGTENIEIYESGHDIVIVEDPTVVDESMLTEELAYKTLNENVIVSQSMVEPSFLRTIQNGYVTPQMFGAIGDGVADDTNAIVQAMNANKDVYFPKGTYLVNNTIYINSNTTILLSASAVIKPTSTGFPLFYMLNVENINISGGTIQEAILCINSSNCVISNSRCSNFQTNNANDCIIDGCNIQAITIIDSNNFKCVNTNITQVGLSGNTKADFINCVISSTGSYLLICSEDSSKTGGNVRFTNCKLNCLTETFPILGSGVSIETLEFIDCSFSGVSQTARIRAKTATFNNCDFTLAANPYNFIILVNNGTSREITFDRCKLNYAPGASGIDFLCSIEASCGLTTLTMRDNTMPNVRFFGITEAAQVGGRFIAYNNFCLNSEAYSSYNTIAKVLNNDNYTINDSNNICV